MIIKHISHIRFVLWSTDTNNARGHVLQIPIMQILGQIILIITHNAIVHIIVCPYITFHSSAVYFTSSEYVGMKSARSGTNSTMLFPRAAGHRPSLESRVISVTLDG